MSALVSRLADIRDTEFESAWIYTIVVFLVATTSALGIYLAFRQVRAMWRDGARGLAVAVAAFAGGALVMFASILATLAVNFVNLANGPGGTP
jgi:protein-S-isoprenylcysteine O-methyltransferase Ste14